MTDALEAATFAWRFTAEGVDALVGSFNAIVNAGKAANTNLGNAVQPANAALQALTNNLGGVAKNIDGLVKLRNELFAIAGVGGIAEVVNKSLEAAENIKKMSGEAGMAVIPYQELIYALKQFGIDQDAATTAMTKFSQNTDQFVEHNTGSAKNAYITLFGANAQQIAQQGLANIDQFFVQVLGKIGAIQNKAEQLDLLKNIFGRGSPQLIEAAQAGIDKINEERAAAEQLGVVFSEDMVNSAAEAHVKIGDLFTILTDKLYIAIDENADAIKNMAEVGIDLIPVLTGAFQGVANVVANLRDGVTAIALGLYDIYKFTANATSHIPVPDSFYGPGGKKAAPDYTDGLVNPLDAFDGNPGLGTGDTGLHVTVHPNQTSTTKPPPLGDDAAVKAAQQEQQAYEKLTYSLNEQIKALGTTDRELFIVNEERKLGKNATDAQKASIDALAGTLYDEKLAWENVKQAAHGTANAIDSALENAIVKGQKFHDVLKNLEQTLLDILYKFFIGNPLQQSLTGGLEKVFGSASSSSGTGLFSSIMNFFGGGKAGGGPLDQGKWYVAGEYGPEPIWGGGAGAFAAGYPSKQQPGSNAVNHYWTVDMRGASVEAVSRLEKLVNQVNSSVETRALNAYSQARVRSRQFQGG